MSRTEERHLFHRKSILVGACYFLLFSALFFSFVYLISLKRSGEFGWQSREKVALIRVEGVIVDSREVIKALRRHQKDPEVKAILLRVDSPGGAVAPSQEIYDTLKDIQSEGEKKLVTSMGTVAASGGYYIASATDMIVANPGTLTGSIGVIMELTNLEGLMQKIGIESVTIKSGENKDVGSPFRKMKPAERAILQNVLDDVHSQFIEAVAEGRSLGVDAVRKLADGRIFSGRQAKNLGLVDELGGLEAAIQLAAELGGIEGKPEVVEMEKNIPFLQILNNKFKGTWSASGLPSGSVGMHYLYSFCYAM